MQASPRDPKTFLLELFQIAVGAANPHQVLHLHLPADTTQAAIVVGAGKAAAAMASALENRWQGPLSGIVVTPYGHAAACNNIEVVEAAHPIPDGHGEIVARRMLKLVSNLTEQDLVICLLSGGGSALLALPAPGISLADKQAINRQLLQSGAMIDEINCVRKHLSAIKGGRLARACLPARLLTFAISDAPDDQPSVIASGPTVADPTTSAEALAILERYHIEAPAHVITHLQNEDSETPKPHDPTFTGSQFTTIATAHHALRSAADAARSAGVEVLVLDENIQGDAQEIAGVHAQLARDIRQRSRPGDPPCLILSGGETTVAVHGSGRGGRNGQFLLALGTALAGEPGIHAIAADTDGIDGSGDNAGALLHPDSLQRALDQGIDAIRMLHDNNAYNFFAAIDDLVITGPTRTNVNDFRAILVLS